MGSCNSCHNPVVVKSKSQFISQVILRRGNSMATPTVHNRGRGYSNSLTLSRDCTLSPQHLIHPSGTNPEFTILSMRIINPNLSITRPSISTSPVPPKQDQLSSWVLH